MVCFFVFVWLSEFVFLILLLARLCREWILEAWLLGIQFILGPVCKVFDKQSSRVTNIMASWCASFPYNKKYDVK
jgi:hypothetical protein